MLLAPAKLQLPLHPLSSLRDVLFSRCVVHVVLSVFPRTMRFLLTFTASCFSGHLGIRTASGFAKHSSFGRHGVDGTTHFSSFSRASEITLRYSASLDEASEIPSSWASFLQFGLFPVPSRYILLLLFISQIVLAMFRVRSHQVVWPFGLLWVDRHLMYPSGR